MLNPEHKIQEKTLDDKRPVLETIAERVHRHLRDKKSEISEDDIRNARIVWDVEVNENKDSSGRV